MTYVPPAPKFQMAQARFASHKTRSVPHRSPKCRSHTSSKRLQKIKRNLFDIDTLLQNETVFPLYNFQQSAAPTLRLNASRRFRKHFTQKKTLKFNNTVEFTLDSNDLLYYNFIRVTYLRIILFEKLDLQFNWYSICSSSFFH